MIDMLNDPEYCRELGKTLISESGNDSKKRETGIRLVMMAFKANDPEAIYIVARLMFDGVLRPGEGDRTEVALTLMCKAANSGCAQARAYLNGYCEGRYEYQVESKYENKLHPKYLTDFDGKRIKLDRSGIRTPVDVKLDYQNRVNLLSISTNVKFEYPEELIDRSAFEQAVLSGIAEWAGDYEVFGGQKLHVDVKVTTQARAYDNIVVMPITPAVRDAFQMVANRSGNNSTAKQLDDIVDNGRSFMISGIKWTVNSRKVIFIQSPTGFSDLDEIKHTAKHEFGHALGLGDLYSNSADQLGGVESGTYTELDSYLVSNKLYNLVMCDHHGPISNNDIEMVILAFRENKMQLYQPSKIKGKISSALGKGN